MRLTFDPFRLLLISLAGCLSQPQQDVIDYLQEENRVLREQLGSKRLRWNDPLPDSPSEPRRFSQHSLWHDPNPRRSLASARFVATRCWRDGCDPAQDSARKVAFLSTGPLFGAGWIPAGKLVFIPNPAKSLLSIVSERPVIRPERLIAAFAEADFSPV